MKVKLVFLSAKTVFKFEGKEYQLFSEFDYEWDIGVQGRTLKCAPKRSAQRIRSISGSAELCDIA